MVIPTQRSLSLNDHQFINTFTNTDIQTRTSSIARVVFSVASFLYCSNKQPTPGEYRTFHTTRCRRTFRAFRMCVHGNRQHFCIGRRRPRGSSCNTQRHCSATMFGVFLHCVLCCLISWATHGLPADRAPVHRGCPCRHPLGCPLIPRQDGVRDKASTLWLLLLTAVLQTEAVLIVLPQTETFFQKIFSFISFHLYLSSFSLDL